MAVEVSMYNVSVRPYLNNGLDSSGNIKVIAGSFPALDKTYYSQNLTASREAAMNVVEAMAPLLEKTVYTTRETITNTLIKQ